MPPPLIIICSILAALALLIIFVLSLRGTLTIAYDSEFSLTFSVLFFKFRIFPLKEKRQKHRVRHMSRRRAAKIKKKYANKPRGFLESAADLIKKFVDFVKKSSEEEKDTEKKPAEKKEEPTEKKGISFKLTVDDVSTLLDLLELSIELVALTVKRFSRHLRIKVARLKVTVGSPDAATTAVTYGAVTQLINVLLPMLREIKNFSVPSKKNFDVAADFTADKPSVDMKLSFSLRVWHLLDIPLPAIGKLFTEAPKYIDKLLTRINKK